MSLAMAMPLRDESYRRNFGMAARETILDRLMLAHRAESLARGFIGNASGGPAAQWFSRRAAKEPQNGTVEISNARVEEFMPLCLQQRLCRLQAEASRAQSSRSKPQRAKC